MNNGEWMMGSFPSLNKHLLGAKSESHLGLYLKIQEGTEHSGCSPLAHSCMNCFSLLAVMQDKRGG
jgi:hypothetical protein